MLLLILALVFGLLATGTFLIEAARDNWPLTPLGLALMAIALALLIADAMEKAGAFD